MSSRWVSHPTIPNHHPNPNPGELLWNLKYSSSMPSRIWPLLMVGLHPNPDNKWEGYPPILTDNTIPDLILKGCHFLQPTTTLPNLLLSHQRPNHSFVPSLDALHLLIALPISPSTNDSTRKLLSIKQQQQVLQDPKIHPNHLKIPPRPILVLLALLLVAELVQTPTSRTKNLPILERTLCSRDEDFMSSLDEVPPVRNFTRAGS